MRSDRIPNHDRMFFQTRCFECGEVFDKYEDHECLDLDDDYGVDAVDVPLDEPA